MTNHSPQLTYPETEVTGADRQTAYAGHQTAREQRALTLALANFERRYPRNQAMARADLSWYPTLWAIAGHFEVRARRRAEGYEKADLQDQTLMLAEVRDDPPHLPYRPTTHRYALMIAPTAPGRRGSLARAPA